MNAVDGRTLVGARVLIVEDDVRIRQELVHAVEAAGARAEAHGLCSTAAAALQQDFDVAIIDLGLPDGDGLQLCRSLREVDTERGLIVLTARDAPESRVQGLDAGADDYIVKPFFMQEVLARIRSVLRRSGALRKQEPIRWSDLEIVPADRTVRRAGQALTLTRREFDLLLFLVRHPGRVWPREALLRRVWPQDDERSSDKDTRTVDLHVQRLRSKIEHNPRDPQLICTVWGVGYVMEQPS